MNVSTGEAREEFISITEESFAESCSHPSSTNSENRFFEYGSTGARANSQLVARAAVSLAHAIAFFIYIRCGGIISNKLSAFCTGVFANTHLSPFTTVTFDGDGIAFDGGAGVSPKVG